MPSGSPLEEPRDPRIRLTTGRDSGCARMISARDKAGGRIGISVKRLGDGQARTARHGTARARPRRDTEHGAPAPSMRAWVYVYPPPPLPIRSETLSSSVPGIFLLLQQLLPARREKATISFLQRAFSEAK